MKLVWNKHPHAKGITIAEAADGGDYQVEGRTGHYMVWFSPALRVNGNGASECVRKIGGTFLRMDEAKFAAQEDEDARNHHDAYRGRAQDLIREAMKLINKAAEDTAGFINAYGDVSDLLSRADAELQLIQLGREDEASLASR